MVGKRKKIYIKTFGCIQNRADSERIRAFYWNKGYDLVQKWKETDLVIINSCIVRQSAENRVYGLINNIDKYRKATGKRTKIVLTGCLVGLRGKKIKEKLPQVDILPISEISDQIKPLRDGEQAALIPISAGCDNFCSYCIVPYARGRERSRKKEEILAEVDRAIEEGFWRVILIGQNVNSYGKGQFADLLETVAKKKLKKVSFVSSNPWDFSDELIEVIARYKNIDRLIHLPLQSGDDGILKKMSRPYTAKQYLRLVEKIRQKVDGVRFSTDILIGFPEESLGAFENTVKMCRKVGFELAYLNKYSPRPGTVSAKLYQDNVPWKEKQRRWRKLNDLINKKLS